MAWNHVHFLPWQGDGYGRPNPYGLPPRLLVLGESHYVKDTAEAADGTLTRQVVEEAARGDSGHWLFRRVARAVTGVEDAGVESDFWRWVAFANYVQAAVGSGARVAPTAAAFEASRDAFWELLDVLAPSHVLALGVRLWWKMPIMDKDHPQGRPLTVGDVTTDHGSYRCGRVLAMRLHHPSSGRFSAPVWHPVIRAFLQLESAPG